MDPDERVQLIRHTVDAKRTMAFPRRDVEFLLAELEACDAQRADARGHAAAAQARVYELEAALREFRRDFTAFITAFEANDPYSADGEQLAVRIDGLLADDDPMVDEALEIDQGP